MRLSLQFPSSRLVVLGTFALLAACAADKDNAGDGVADTSGADTAANGTFNDVDDDGPGNTGGNDGGPGGDDANDATEDDAADTEDDGGSFIEKPDGGSIGNQCDPAEQDCPKGEKCTSYVSVPGGKTVDATKCVPDEGDGLAGEPCLREAENDDCAAGFFCMTDVSGHTGEGFCLEYCNVMTMECEFGGECFAFNDGALPVCEVTCDPLLQDCPNGQGCYAAFEDFVCAVPGHPEGQGADGDECATVQGCQPGLLCRTGTNGCAGTSCCTPVCSLSGGGEECTDGSESCVAALDAPPPMLMDVGFCAIPE